MNLYLARHGQDEDNAKGILNGHRDTPLTQFGMDQSKKLAHQIKGSGLKFDRIYTSPLQRAVQTAEIITHALQNLKPVILEDLIERDFGFMTGKSTEDIANVCSPEIIKTDQVVYFLTGDGVETFPELFKRAKRLLGRLRKDHLDREENILLVTHGDLGKMMYAAAKNLEWEKVLTHFHFGNAEVLNLNQS